MAARIDSTGGRFRSGRAWLQLVVGVVALGLGYWFGDFDRLRFYQSERTFMQHQDRLGYQSMGRFGTPRWPAVVLDRRDGKDGIVFTTPDGQVHEYPNYVGYDFKAVTLRPKRAKSEPFVFMFKKRR